MWKLLAEKVTGPSHLQHGLPCQDSFCTALESLGEETVLVLACADGAGSAMHGERGAELACARVVQLVLADLREGQTVAGIDADAAFYWLQSTRLEIEHEAAQLQVGGRELACTLMLAVVGDEAAAFAQVGDGAIVVRDGDAYTPIFWQDGGEYVNSTFFLTDARFERRLSFARRAECVDELALFTDGLQRLALNLATRTGHRPFFEPMFQQLRQADRVEALAGPLRQFLASPRVAQRSDDDKTLILATRMPSRAAEPNAL